jgi:hypothetical protein
MTLSTLLPDGRRRIASMLAVACLTLVAARADAQVRERPIAFDSAGRILAITPPLAARLGLSTPVWPVSGDYVDVRLYALDDSAGSAVLVVRRQREVLERYPLSASQRLALASAVERGVTLARAAGGRDSLPTRVSDPVRGGFVVNQSLLGLLLFGPSAAALTGNAAAGTAVYLAVAGGTFFIAADRASSLSISSAESHLAWHGARQGAAAAYLATYALGGEDIDEKAYAAALLAGGLIGDVVGYRMARPMTDAEAHGVSHGATVTTVLTAGLLGTADLSRTESARRTAAAVLVGAQFVGYPLGMRYVRRAPYRVTAGDVGTLVVGELLGTAAAASFIPDESDNGSAISAVLTAGFGLGLVAGDRLLARPFDYTESESRLLQFGTVAGGVVGLAIPVLAEADDSRAILGAATAGGLLGALLTHRLLAPARAGEASPRRSERRNGEERFGVRFTPQNLLLARTGGRGLYPVMNIAF